MANISLNTRGWVVVIASFLIQFITNGTQYAYSSGTMAEEKKEAFHNDDVRGRVYIKILLIALPVVTQTIGFLVCLFISRFGCRNISIAGASISGLALVLTSAADYYQYYPFAARALQGIGYGMLNCSTILCVAHHFEKKRTLAIALIQSGAHLGRFAYTPFTRFLLDMQEEHWGWNGVGLIHAGLVFNCIPFGLLLSPLPAEKSQRSKAARSCDAKKTARQKEHEHHGLVAMEEIRQERADEFGASHGAPSAEHPLDVREEDFPQTSAHGAVRADSTVPELRGTCWNSFKETMGFSLFRNPIFRWFTISNVFGSIAFTWPLISLSPGIDDSASYEMYRIEVLIAQIIVPIIFGMIAAIPKVTIQAVFVKLYTALLLCCGFLAVMIPFSNSTKFEVRYALIVFACFHSCFTAWTPILLIEFVGLERLVIAFVWLSAAECVVRIVHGVLLGFIIAATLSYAVSLWYTGALTILCGILMFRISCMHRRAQRRARLHIEVPEIGEIHPENDH